MGVRSRYILVDWLLDVQHNWNLSIYTLYLAINILDRYLERNSIEMKKFQLIGITCLLIASKIEDIQAPTIADCSEVTNEAYTINEVVEMERHLLETFNYIVRAPTALPFLNRFLQICKAPKTIRKTASFYSEAALHEYKMLQYKPSLVAFSSVLLALNNRSVRLRDDLFGPLPGIVSLS